MSDQIPDDISSIFEAFKSDQQEAGARELWTAYSAFVNVGFTPKQAFDLLLFSLAQAFEAGSDD